MLSQMTPQYGQGLADDMGASARRGMVSKWFGRRDRGRVANVGGGRMMDVGGGRMMDLTVVGGGGGGSVYSVSAMGREDDGGSFGSSVAGRKRTGLDDEPWAQKRRDNGRRHMSSRKIRRILRSDGSSSDATTNDDPEGDMPSE